MVQKENGESTGMMFIILFLIGCHPSSFFFIRLPFSSIAVLESGSMLTLLLLLFSCSSPLSYRLLSVLDDDECEVVVTTYEMLVSAESIFRTRFAWSYVVVDEVRPKDDDHVHDFVVVDDENVKGKHEILAIAVNAGVSRVSLSNAVCLGLCCRE